MTVQAVQPVEPEWIWLLRGASRFLTLGSVCLLLGGFVFILAIPFIPLGFGVWLLLIVTVAGFVLHLFGWVSLNDAAVWPAMRVTFFASLVGFAVGVATFLYLVRGFGLVLLFGGWLLLPYMPIVWGPVAIAHAFLYLLFYDRLGSRAPLLVVGCLILAIVAGIGMFLQFAFVAGVPVFGWEAGMANWVVFLPGLTSIGYCIGAVEFSSEYEQRRMPLGPFP